MNARISALRERLARRQDSEHQQILVRLIITLVFLAYLSLTQIYAPRPAALAMLLYGAVSIEFVCAIGLLAALLRNPESSNPRRWFGMLLDYSIISLLMIADGARTAPLYVVLMWVTVGYGLRYGPRFLRLAVIHASIVFASVLLLTPYWKGIPYLGWGLLIGLIAVPMYLSGLLRALTRAVDDARRANEAKTRFVATMSHELRSPLNGIIGMSEVLSSTRLTAEQRECADVIQTSAHALLLLVEDVLNFAAIEAGKLHRIDAPFSLRDFLRRLRTLLHPLAAAKNLRFSIDADESVPDALIGDSAHLLQILLNLVGNAIKFTEHGSVALRVEPIGEKGGRRRLRFSIRDTGLGIPADQRARIFKPFEQLDSGPSRKHGGAGLGVTIARTLTELLEGRIDVEDNPGGGTHFWAELPFVVVERSDDEPAAIATRAPSVHNDGAQVISLDNPLVRHRARVRPLRLLVADDLASNRAVMRRLLERAGHTLVFASNGEQALDALSESELDAAILDLHMPDISGLDVLKQARVMQAGRARRTPIVVLSADVTVETMRAVEASGAYAFLSKPVVIERLLDTLARVAESEGKDRPAPMVVARAEAPQGGVLQDLIELGTTREPLEELLQQCLKDAARCVSAFERAAAGRNWEEAREALHALKGVAVNIGAMALAERCNALMRATSESLAASWRRELGELGRLLESAAADLARQIADACAGAQPIGGSADDTPA
jgi:two-component system sensor histidine kinase RpfC